MWQADPAVISGGRDLHVRHGTAGVRGAARWRGGRHGRSRRAPSSLDSAYAASGHVWLIRVFAGRLDNRRPTVDLACESSLRGCRRSPIGGCGITPLCRHRDTADLRHDRFESCVGIIKGWAEGRNERFGEIHCDYEQWRGCQYAKAPSRFSRRAACRSYLMPPPRWRWTRYCKRPVGLVSTSPRRSNPIEGHCAQRLQINGSVLPTILLCSGALKNPPLEESAIRVFAGTELRTWIAR